jgi:hypothetical protein
MVEYKFKITADDPTILSTGISKWIIPFEALNERYPIWIFQITPYGDDAYVLTSCENLSFDDNFEQEVAQMNVSLAPLGVKVEGFRGKFPFED